MKPGFEALRSGAFRFALIFALAFATCSALLLLAVEHAISHYAVEAGEGALKSETAILLSEDNEGGRASLLRAIDRHRRAGGNDAFRYRLIDGAGHVLVNDLGPWPTRTGWGSVAVRESDARSAAKFETFKSLGVTLADGGVLTVAGDTYDILDLRARLDRFMIAAGLAITLFALLGGYLAGGMFIRRLGRVNAAIGRVMAGHVEERLPMIGISREFDLLSSNLNAMLDRIEGLVEGLRQVTTDIAHDLRTPLSRLRQHLEGMRASGRDDAAIASAIRQTDEILAIFRALLRIGSFEGGDGRQYFTPVDLSEVLDRVVAALQPVAEDRNKVLTANIAPDCLVVGDGELLAQMLINLIDNAIRHTPPGTRIAAMLDRADSDLVMTISDDGPGIPEAERGKVLTRFYRLDRSRHMPGAGLGLSMVSAIAALHWFSLELRDSGPGLTVRLTCPPAPPLARRKSAVITETVAEVPEKTSGIGAGSSPVATSTRWRA